MHRIDPRWSHSAVMFCRLLFCSILGLAAASAGQIPNAKALLSYLGPSRLPIGHHTFDDEDLTLLCEAIFYQTEPLSSAIEEEVALLLDQLADDQFQIRAQAVTRLHALGPDIIPLLEMARKDANPEVRHHVRETLADLNSITDPFADLDQAAASKRLEQLLLESLAPEHHSALAARFVAHSQRGSHHGSHQALSQILIEHFIQHRDDEALNLLRPVLDGKDRNMAITVVRTLNPRGELPFIPELLLSVLEHPDEDLLIALFRNRLEPLPNDPRRPDLRTRLLGILSSKLPPETRISAATTLFYDYLDPASAQFFVDLTTTGQTHLVAETLASPLLVGLPLPAPLIETLAPLRLSEDPLLRRDAVNFLLQRTEPKHIRLGVASLSGLGEADLRAIAISCENLIFRDPLAKELRRSIDQNEGPKPSEAATLHELLGLSNNELFQNKLPDAGPNRPFHPLNIPQGFRLR